MYYNNHTRMNFKPFHAKTINAHTYIHTSHRALYGNRNVPKYAVKRAQLPTNMRGAHPPSYFVGNRNEDQTSKVACM